MTDISADETADRIIRSLKANSAEFVRQARLSRSARVRSGFWRAICVLVGVAVGALLTWSR